ncbi:MAG TPA: response regulator [Bryobacteraceae bacterium]|jgi:two-component system cell cycle sensor histidine kinase/response regulator CckA
MPTVLILDDEEGLLKLLAVFLKRSGYLVLPCSSTASALERFQELDGAIDLLIADVALGADSGVEVAMQLKAISPNLACLFISGYPFNSWSARNTLLFGEWPPDSVRVLQKPFSSYDLLNMVDELHRPAKGRFSSGSAAG